MKRLKILNGIKGVVTSRQDHTQISFYLVKKKRKKNLGLGMVLDAFNPSTQETGVTEVSEFKVSLQSTFQDILIILFRV